MRAIILAAGRGSRMGGETADKPKCLTVIAGKSLLEWQLESLYAAGINEVLVVRGYRKELLTGTFEVVDNDLWSQTNMASSLVCASTWLEQGPTIVSYSDIVYHPDHVSALVNSAADIAITADRRWLNLWSLRSENPISDAETFREEGGVLKEIGGRPESLKGISGQYMGLLSFTPSGWQKFHTIYRNLDPVRQKSLDMTSWLMLAINKKYLINVTYVEGRWCEVDCQADLQIYQEQLFAADKLKGSWEHDWRWT